MHNFNFPLFSPISPISPPCSPSKSCFFIILVIHGWKHTHTHTFLFVTIITTCSVLRLYNVTCTYMTSELTSWYWITIWDYLPWGLSSLRSGSSGEKTRTWGKVTSWHFRIQRVISETCANEVAVDDLFWKLNTILKNLRKIIRSREGFENVEFLFVSP